MKKFREYKEEYDRLDLSRQVKEAIALYIFMSILIVYIIIKVIKTIL